MNGIPFLLGLAGLLVIIGLIARFKNHNVGEIFESVAFFGAGFVLLVATVQTALAGDMNATLSLSALTIIVMMVGARIGRFAFTQDWWKDHQSSAT